MHPSVAVIDIGSNSIKVLLASRAPDGGVTVLKSRTIDARISAGISKSDPRLSEEGMAHGLDAITALLADAAPFTPVRTVLVATSAVRDARNGADFRARVRTATGHEIRILTGEEEANLIGRGLTTDPALADLRDFYVFDLGGGSLECLSFRDRRVEQAVSLQLGCVRLTEKFVADPALPFSDEARARVRQQTRVAFSETRFAAGPLATQHAIGTGGTVTSVRAILAAHRGHPFDQSSSTVTVAELEELLTNVGAKTLEERKKIPGLPPARADVFPAALATLIATAEVVGVSAFRNSLHNLRYGLAADALASVAG